MIVDGNPAAGFYVQLVVRFPDGKESNRIPEIIQTLADAGGQPA